MLEDKQTGEVTTTDDHPLANLSAQLQVGHVDEMIAFHLPSPQITPEHMLELANIIDKNRSTYDGFVITHGTDTLEETAYFLDLVIETDKPVIVTGAMRSSNEIGSDALYNLVSSLRVAMEDEARHKGVLVVMNDEIHATENVTKTSTSNVATFQSPQYGPIGIITKDMILFHHTVLARETYSVDATSKHVILLKAYAGMDGRLLESLKDIKPDGIVIEGLGQGNLPKAIMPVIEALLDKKIPIVLVSRCYQGIVQPTYGYEGGGKQLKDKGVILTNGLTGPKARLKLLIALEQPNIDHKKLKEWFEH